MLLYPYTYTKEGSRSNLRNGSLLFIALPLFYILQDADLIAHDVLVVFRCDAIDEVVEDNLHGALPLLAWVLVEGGLDDALLHHLDRRRDRVEDDHRDVLAPRGEDGAGGTGTGGRVRDGDDDFAGFRAHRAADSPRHVAWKALARGGPMLTKQYAAAQGGDVLLDWSALPTHLDEEQRLSRLTAWVLRADQDGRRYGLLLPQTHIAPELGRDHRDRCLRELALFGIAPEDRA